MVVLRQNVFETDELLALKRERSKAEYCWTCTSVIIEYVLNHFLVQSCTYLDSDLYFYSDPKIIFRRDLQTAWQMFCCSPPF